VQTPGYLALASTTRTVELSAIKNFRIRKGIRARRAQDLRGVEGGFLKASQKSKGKNQKWTESPMRRGFAESPGERNAV
jgi:hypothetical protein